MSHHALFLTIGIYVPVGAVLSVLARYLGYGVLASNAWILTKILFVIFMLYVAGLLLARLFGNEGGQYSKDYDL